MTVASTVQPQDGFATRAIHVGSEPDPVTGAVVPNLSISTTFKQDGVGKHRGHEYARTSNPTRSSLEAVLASLETGGSEGAESVVFASGSAATAAMAHWVTLSTEEGGAGGADGQSGGGGHVLAVNDVYGGTARYLSRAARPTGLNVTYLDLEKAGEAGIREAIRPDTRLIWLELPTNPNLIVPPLPLISSIVHSLPESSRPLILVDTTFLSPFYVTPLVPGADGVPYADIVLSSLSKYSSGHSDIILGALTISATVKASRPNLSTGLRFLQNSLGASASPRDSHLMIRSLKTLAPRMVRHGLNALRIAAWLKDRPDIESVRYPGLSSDAAFPLAEQLLSASAQKELKFLGWKLPFVSQPTGADDDGLSYIRTLGIPFGGVIAFSIKDVTAQQTEQFVTNLRLSTLAESLGGVESLVEVPAGMTHAGLPEATRLALGINHNLIRFSVGIEDADDLIADLDASLAAIRTL